MFLRLKSSSFEFWNEFFCHHFSCLFKFLERLDISWLILRHEFHSFTENKTLQKWFYDKCQNYPGREVFTFQIMQHFKIPLVESIFTFFFVKLTIGCMKLNVIFTFFCETQCHFHFFLWNSMPFSLFLVKLIKVHETEEMSFF